MFLISCSRVPILLPMFYVPNLIWDMFCVPRLSLGVPFDAYDGDADDDDETFDYSNRKRETGLRVFLRVCFSSAFFFLGISDLTS